MVVNDDKLKTYRYIIEAVINDGKTPTNIAYDLNNQGILSPRNGVWHGVTISRLIVDETHLGKIISNKTEGDGHANKKPDARAYRMIPKDQWVVIENCHEPVKTVEEHEKILMFTSRLTNMPKRKSKQVRALSGLVKCAYCGHTMSLDYRPNRKNPESLKPCWYHDSLGNKCTNSGMITNLLYEHINEKILVYKEQLAEKIDSIDVGRKRLETEKKLSNLKQELSQNEKALENMLNAFEKGIYSLELLEQRKEKADKIISEIKKQIRVFEIEQKHYSKQTFKDKHELITKFEKQIQSSKISQEQKNELYKSIIDKIIWKRKNNNIKIDIVFK